MPARGRTRVAAPRDPGISWIFCSSTSMRVRTARDCETPARVVSLPIPILTTEATEEPDFSSQRLRCKILRDDVEDGALALIFAAAVLSFHDAQPRGTSHIDSVERDEWTLDGLCRYLHFSKGTLCLDTDYVRGRMMKTRVTVWPTWVVEIQTTNRHQMASRWVETLKGKKHLRVVSGETTPPGRPNSRGESRWPGNGETGWSRPSSRCWLPARSSATETAGTSPRTSRPCGGRSLP